MDNPDTGTIGYIRHMTKKKPQKAKKISNPTLPKNTGLNPGAREG